MQAYRDDSIVCQCCGGWMPARVIWEARRNEAGDCTGSINDSGRCRAWADDALWSVEPGSPVDTEADALADAQGQD